MAFRMSRRLSAAAIVSASLVGLAVAPQAGATVAGVPASSPLTVSHTDGSLETVGGGTSSVPWAGTDVSWSPDGSKYAFSANNQIYTANADGSGLKIVAHGAASGAQPVWAYGGELLVFAGWDPTVSSSGPTQLMATWSNGAANDNGLPVSWPLPKVAAAGTADSSPDYGGDVLAFARATVSGGTNTSDGIWIRSNAGNYVPFQVASSGVAPTVSPDGKTVAFVQADKNKVPQIWTVPTSVPAGGLPTPVQQTFVPAGSASTPTITVANPVFSPDGRRIAFDETSVSAGAAKGTSQVRSVALNTDPKATVNTEVVFAVTGALSGTEHLAYRTEYTKQVLRLAGSDRLGTAQSVSQSQWRNNGDASDSVRSQASVAVLSRDDLPADALAGSTLAARQNGPLLLTGSTALSPQAAAELKRILPAGATVYLLGGTQALSPAVANSVHALGFTVVRIAGADRYDTAVKIADRVTAHPSQILVATGNDFADALSAGAAAGANYGAVVVLSDDKTMPAETAQYLHRFGTDFGPNSDVVLTAVGGQALAAIDSEHLGYWRVKLVGADRYQTSYLVASTFFPYMTAAGVATGSAWPDALSGGAAMGSMGGPLLLVNPATGLSGQDTALLDANRGELSGGFVFGGPVAVPTGVDKELAKAIAGPLGVIDGGGNKVAAAGSGSGVAGSGVSAARAAADLASALPSGAHGLAKPVRP
ncbi:hypothetical protein ABH920_009410 [Catenulispora sp. EB89]|uniref:cell wall-binding repeat-containing protein n=1 Tax=Catenulispora sp. EB89 TaxID=3156257 RepID=UPI0035164195